MLSNLLCGFLVLCLRRRDVAFTQRTPHMPTISPFCTFQEETYMEVSSVISSTIQRASTERYRQRETHHSPVTGKDRRGRTHTALSPLPASWLRDLNRYGNRSRHKPPTKGVLCLQNRKKKRHRASLKGVCACTYTVVHLLSLFFQLRSKQKCVGRCVAD